MCLFSKENMAGKEYVQHEGVVTGISVHTLEVTINSHSACSGCHAKSACGMADMKQKVITTNRPAGNFQIGDKVMVYAAMSNAVYSVILAYVMPSILIIAAIFFLQETGSNELSAAVTSLLLLIIYFFILYLFRNKIGKKIKFTVKKIGNY